METQGIFLRINDTVQQAFWTLSWDFDMFITKASCIS